VQKSKPKQKSQEPPRIHRRISRDNRQGRWFPDVPATAGSARLAQQLATILFLQGSFRVIRRVRDGSFNLFVQLRFYPAAMRRQCLKTGNGY
jgi:hypothetical protein